MSTVLNTRKLVAARVDTEHQAALLEFEQDDGSTAGLLVEKNTLPMLLRALYTFAKVDGEAHPPEQALAQTPASHAVVLPCDELATKTTQQGTWLVSRTGSLDTAIALPDREAIKALAEALLRHAETH